MPSFDVVAESTVPQSYRVARVANDYDLRADTVVERFTGEIDMPVEWNVGLIVGSSGTGKTTIARELFGSDLVSGFDWDDGPVIDCMPADATVDDITRAFYQVGFASVPTWLKPYGVLSNGERMRCDLARAILEREFVAFDEFTSVVDRNVAKTISTAVSRGVRERGSKFVAVSCHRDIIEWLQPDWVFDTDVMRPLAPSRQGRGGSSRSSKATRAHGNAIGAITI